MNLQNTIRITPLLLLAFLWAGCAVIFSPGKQHVTVKSATPGATIMFDGDSIGTGNASLKLSKYKVYNTFTAEKEGYKSRNYCVTLNKRAPTLAFMALDVFGIIIPSVNIASGLKKQSTTLDANVAIIPGLFLGSIILTDLTHAKTHRYDNEQTIPELVPYELRGKDEKFLLVNNTSIDVKSGEQKSVTYSRLNNYYKSDTKHQRGKSYTKDDLKIDDLIFTGSLNYTLKNMRFIDTTNHVFPNINNSLYLNSTIKSITFHEVKSPYSNTAQYSSKPSRVMPNHLFAIELSIDWDVLDFYKQKVATIRTVEKSDLFTIPYGSGSDEIQKTVVSALKDNMDFSIMNLRRQLSDKKLLAITNVKENNTTIELARPQAQNRTKEDFRKSCVIITTDDGFGSGTVISEDGYIVTNYHLLAGTKKITVTFSDSTTAEAEVVRKAMDADMALLKVKKTGLIPFTLSQDNDPEIGGDVWAVGAAGSVELGVNLSHGIISGVRKTNGMLMLQTDAGLNKGNSGGALVNEKGIAMGIVSLKLMGKGVEGIGFALATKDVMDKLGLKYK